MALSATCKALQPHSPLRAPEERWRNTTRHLARQMTPRLGPTAELEARLLRLALPRRLGPLMALHADCRDLIWASDKFMPQQILAPRKFDHGPLSLTDNRRRDCLAYMYAAQHDRRFDEGLIAVAEARRRKGSALCAIVFMDAAAATAAVSCLYLGAALGAAGVMWGTSTYKAGIAAGTYTGKLKAGAAVAATGGWVLVAAGVAGYGVVTLMRHWDDWGEDHKEIWHGYRGRDLVLCELIAGRRYRFPRPRPQ